MLSPLFLTPPPPKKKKKKSIDIINLMPISKKSTICTLKFSYILLSLSHSSSINHNLCYLKI